MKRIAYRIYNPHTGSFQHSGSTPSMLAAFFSSTAQLAVADGMEYQQNTLILDANGREVYEGDVVRNWQGGWNIAVYKAPAFAATVSADQSSSYSLEWWANVEIIGNIYENPDLLKGGQP